MLSEFLHQLMLASLSVLTIPLVIVFGMFLCWAWDRFLCRVLPYDDGPDRHHQTSDAFDRARSPR